MGQGESLAGALRVENITTVATMVLSVCERKWCPTPHTDVGIDPLWGLP
jgi:hypothetical protein